MALLDGFHWSLYNHPVLYEPLEWKDNYVQLYIERDSIEVWGYGSLTTLPDMIERLIAEYHSLKSFHASATGQVGRCG